MDDTLTHLVKYDHSWDICKLAKKWFEQSRHRILIIPKEGRGKYRQNTFKRKNGRRNYIRIRGSILQGKCINTLLSVILNENILVKLTIER